MTTTDEILRETFAAQAAMTTMPAGTRDRIGRLARRHRARRAVAIAGTAVAVTTIAIAGPALIASDSSTSLNVAAAPADTDYALWPARGDLGDDAAVAAAATAAWDAEAPATAPHTGVKVLWADDFPTGRAVVMVGTDSDGARRLAIVDAHSSSMWLLRDVPAPANLSHISFSLFNDDQEHSAASYRDTLVVITPPASGWTVEWAGGDDPSAGSGTVTTEDGIAIIDISQSGPQGRPTIRLMDGSEAVYEGPIGTMS